MSWRLWEPCEYLGYSNILWNYLEVNYLFWIKCDLWALYVLPICCDMWLLGDYLARYYSLCDIGILVPVFVMVIEFRLCDGDEFHLCDGILVPSLWRHCHVALGLELYCYCSQNIVCSFMQAFWEVLCRIIFNHSCHIIFGNGFVEFIWKFPNYHMLCKLFIIMKLAFPIPLLE